MYACYLSIQKAPEFKVSLGYKEFYANLSYKLRKTFFRGIQNKAKNKNFMVAKIKCKIKDSLKNSLAQGGNPSIQEAEAGVFKIQNCKTLCQKQTERILDGYGGKCFNSST